MRVGRGLAAGAAVLAAGGCTHPSRPLRVEDPDVSVKVPAIKQAVRLSDVSATDQLVADLDSDDAAVRFFAIGALRQLVGEDYGYLYYADRADRQVPLLKWRAWLVRQQVRPATDTAGGE